MRWPYPQRGDVIGLLFVAVILLGVIAVGYYQHTNALSNAGNYGFGPEWDCTANGRGDPICIKKLGR
jgi:hypothetical protein